MARMKYNTSKDRYEKQCTRCEAIYYALGNWFEAAKRLQEFFCEHPNTYDGLQYYCRRCQHQIQRKHNGLIVSHEEVEELFARQQGKCAICPSPIKFDQGRGCGAQMDHDHNTGKPRGLLCLNCNQALGKFQDDPAILLSAIRYLSEHGKSLFTGSLGCDSAVVRP